MDEPEARRHLPSDWTGMDRVRHDIDDGRLWKARDRLHGMLSAHGRGPRSSPREEVLDMLGHVYFRMGDLPQAGRCWFLTEREDPDAQSAIDAWRQRFGNHPKALAESLSEYAYDLELQPVARARAAELNEHVPPPLQVRSVTDLPDDDTTVREVLGIGAVLIGTVGVWVIGVIALVRWLV